MKFTIKQNGQDVELEVVAPSIMVKNQADAQKAKTVVRLAKEGVPLRFNADGILRQQGLWSDEKEKEVEEIAKELRESEFILRKGGISLWTEARGIALKMRELRQRLSQLSTQRNSLDNYTAEGIADSESIPFLLSKCVLKDGKPYYKNVDDVLEKNKEEGAGEILLNFMKVFYDWSPEDITERFENKFLIEKGLAKVIDYEGEKTVILINKNGQTTDDEGRLIDEKFRYIDSNNNLVDKWGNKVDEEGILVVEELPFTE